MYDQEEMLWIKALKEFETLHHHNEKTMEKSVCLKPLELTKTINIMADT